MPKFIIESERTYSSRNPSKVPEDKTQENVNMQNQLALVALVVVIVLGVIAIAVVATSI